MLAQSDPIKRRTMYTYASKKGYKCRRELRKSGISDKHTNHYDFFYFSFRSILLFRKK